MRDFAGAKRSRQREVDQMARLAPGRTSLRESADPGTTSRGPRGSVFSTFQGPTELAQQGTCGAGQPLPHLEAIQRSFGRHDVRSVRSHIGGAAAQSADALNANAYAVGDAIGFAARPDLRTAAHEAAHIVQQRSGVQLDGGIDGGKRDPYEQHADAVANAVVAGQSAEHLLDAAPGGGGDRIGVQRDSRDEELHGNPGELVENGSVVTEHRNATMADTANHVAPTEAADAEQSSFVKVQAGARNPLRFPAWLRPKRENLFAERTLESVAPPAGYQEIDGLHGTIDQPLVEELPAPGLYINGAPSPDDVHQGYIGDCYFEAMLMSLAQRDPGKIKSIMKPDGAGGATVTLWRREDHKDNPIEWLLPFLGPKYDYIPVHIHCSGELWANKGGGLRAARLRSAPKPLTSDWWASVNESAKLEVHRKDTYEVARWAPLMEKAFARIAQQHGQYAGARGGAAAQPDGSGYNVIGGGWMTHTLPLIYGPEADTDAAAVKSEGTTWSPEQNAGAALLAANQGALDLLIQLQGRGVTPGDEDVDAPNVTAAALEGDMVHRLGPAVQAALADPELANIDREHQAMLRNVSDVWNNWNNMPPDANGGTAKADAYKAIKLACGTAAFDGPLNPEGFDKVTKSNPGTIRFTPYHEALPVEEQIKLMGLSSALAMNPSPAMTVNVIAHQTSMEYPHDLLSQRRADEIARRLQQGVIVVSASGSQKMTNQHTVHARGIGAEGATWEPTWQRAEIGVVANQAHNPLHSARSASIQAAMDFMIDLRNMGTDFSPSQRNIFGNHAYSVVGAYFVDSAYQAVPLRSTRQSERAKLFPRVDTKLSTVRVRNPHHGGEPDRRGDNKPARTEDGAPGGAQSDGMFTMSLEQFFRNFNSVHSGTFRRS